MSVPEKNKTKKKIAKGYFIAGTDTGVGKTLIASSVVSKLWRDGKRVAVLKPVASGSEKIGDVAFSSDVSKLLRHGVENGLLYSDINPFLFHEQIAPHIAAKKNGIELSVKTIIQKSDQVLTSDADYVVIEGAGGWCVPLNDDETMADLALAYGYPVILVVGIRLGCINHTLLTYKSMCDLGVLVHGWVANVIDNEMLCLEENIEAIKSRIAAPLLGVVPYDSDICYEEVDQLL